MSRFTVTYVGGPDGCISIQSSRSSNPTTHSTTLSTSKPSKPSSMGDILNDLRAQESESSQLRILEYWLSKLAKEIKIKPSTLAQIVGLFASGTNQVSAVQQCVEHGVNDFQAAHAVKIVQSISSGTDQKDAVKAFVRLFKALSCEQVAQIVSPIQSDTDVVDAIKILVPKILIRDTNYVLLTQCCRSDTYKVDVLKAIHSQTHCVMSPEDFNRIMTDIHSDTDRIDAANTILGRNPPGDYWRSISTIQSDTYKLDFAKIVKPNSISTHDLDEIINRMSKSYRADLLKHWLPSVLEENVEELLEMVDSEWIQV